MADKLTSSNPQQFSPDDIAEAISHASDTHGNNLFRAMSTGAFSRLGLGDQVEVVKSFAGRMSDTPPKNQPFDYKSSAQAALKGAGEGAAAGATTGTLLRLGHWAKFRLNSEERDYDMSEFLKSSLPTATAVGAGVGAVKSGVGSYLDSKHSQANQQSQFDKLMQIKSESDDRKKNMLALSLLSSSGKLTSRYESPRKSTAVENLVGEPTSRATMFASTPQSRPDKADVAYYQARKTDALAASEEERNRKKNQ